ncbi:sugar ABC transporter permease [Faecalicatena contorta]|jgi:ABC-type sugar transport system permease subunit|uniref:carbohydrate ABC transporter permease n=1 Tax=Faecalicatena contorta TaxID=39482 RepID=UPI0031DE2793
MKKKFRISKLAPYLFIMPFMISFIIFFAVPSLYSLILSLFKYKGYGGMKFVGFDNYLSLLQYGTFWKAIGNTLFIYVVHIIPVMVISFLLAVALNSGRVFLSRYVKGILFLPQITSVVATALIFRILLSTRTGVINSVLGTKIPFIEDPRFMKWSIVALVIWRSIGWFMVIFLAGLTTIDESVNDAAAIDGANAFRRMIHITIPIMKPIFMFAFVMETISSFKFYTESTLLITGGQSSNIPTASMTIMNLLTTNINGGAFGMASAVGWILFLMILVVSLIQFRIFKEE